MFSIKNFQLREYQKNILDTAKEKNTLVVLPTGLGKTKIAIALSVERLNKFPGSKIIMCSPTKPLSAQIQAEFIDSTNIPIEKISLLTGQLSPKIRKELFQDSAVIIATPQTIQSDLKNNRISLLDTSLLAIDECVTKDTRIRLVNEQEIKIEDLYKEFSNEKDIYIQSLNKNTGEIEPTLISKIHKIKNDKKIIKIKTKNNNEIKITEDHLILTKRNNKIGWIKAKELKRNYEIAFHSYTGKKLSNRIIINEKDVLKTFKVKQQKLVNCYKKALKLRENKNWSSRNIAKGLKINEYTIRNYINSPYQKPIAIHLIKKLKKENLLPLRYSNPKLKIISRIIGHIYGDGWYYQPHNRSGTIGFSGKIEDLKRIQKDLKLLNIKYPKIHSRKTKSTVNHLEYGNKNINGISNSIHITDSKLTRIIKALKVHIGNKTNKETTIPKWLMKAPKIIKKEFLSALMGSDGSKPKIKKGTRQPEVIRLAFYKIKELKKNGIEYTNQLKSLFKEFKIDCNISIKKGNLRKDKKETLKFLVTLSNSNEQIMQFLKDINYAYNMEKRKEANRILKYLIHKKEDLELRRKLYKKSLKLTNKGLKYKEISNKLNINEGVIRHWLNKEKPAYVSPNIKTYEIWKKKNIDYLDTEWDKVKEIKNTKKEEYIYDLTIDENHNYIANNIVVHNCHRSRMNFANTKVARFYIQQSKNQRIIALTASPGSSIDKINEIKQNLNINAVEIRSEYDNDVKNYVQEKKIDLIKVELPQEFIELKELLNNLYKQKLKKIKKLGLTKPLTLINKRDLLSLQSRFAQEIKNKNQIAYYGISLTAQAIKLEHAITILETQGIKPLNKYFEKLESEDTKASKIILNDNLIKKAVKLSKKLTDFNHPKLTKLSEIIAEELTKNPNSKIIVFANYRFTVDELVSFLKNIPHAKPIKLVGQKEGLTQKQQAEVIKEFDEGNYNILITTSIGEEGINIPKGAELAVFYEPIPSEIRSIQRKGRVGRIKVGNVIFLITKSTKDEAYYWSSFHKEKKMKRILYGMQNKKETQTKLK